jgi:hypothetical protein
LNDIDNIKHLQYFDRFTNIRTYEITLFPKHMKKLTFDFQFNEEINNISNSVTHLTFGKKFNKKIIGYLPNSITHLIFDDSFYFQISIRI